MTVGNSVVVGYEIPFEDIESRRISFKKELSGYVGINPDTRKRDIPVSLLPTPDEHFSDLMDCGVFQEDKAALLFTARNLMQNLRMPFYAGGKIIQSRIEECHKSKRLYQGVAWRKDGTMTAEDIDFSKTVPSDIETFMAMSPVLRNGKPLALSELCPEFFDSRHLWTVKGDDFSEIAETFKIHRHSTNEEASKAILDSAKGQTRDESFLHHAVGLTATSVVHFATVGSPEHVARTSLKLNTSSPIKDCFIVEQGGSLQFSGYRTDFPGDRDKRRRVLWESWYFREPSIAMIGYRLKTPRTDRAPFKYVTATS